MEPGSLSPAPSPEMSAYHPPEAPKGPGEGLANVPEKAPAKIETESNPQGGANSTPVMALPQLPTLPAPIPTTDPVAVNSSSPGPLLAADEDLVEKEWVDKAKRIVAQTKNDPFNQEKEVSKLQADYLKKRYGKELKLSGE
jgi:hypothetical protein